ncbi:MAG: hypothetical protein ACREDF_06430 [Thermoplasmata archaeon]
MASVSRLFPIIVAMVSCTLLLGASSPVAGALQKPTYSPGDRWIYVLEGSLRGFPGLNETQVGQFRFSLVGRVEVEIVGFRDISMTGGTVSTIAARMHTTGFLNGTLIVPGFGSAQVTGTFGFSSSEFWEPDGYLPIEASSTTSFVAQVASVITADLAFTVRLNATGSLPSSPPFQLGVGESVTASTRTRVQANATVTVSGVSRSVENNTEVSSIWRRELGPEESVHVEAGRFVTHRFNQTLGAFPGIPLIAGGIETAYFSNDVGYYAKRVGYQNGTPVAEMRLKSYSYGQNSGLRLTTLLILILIPVAIILLAAFLVWRRRAARKARRKVRAGQPPSAGREGGGGNAR